MTGCQSSVPCAVKNVFLKKNNMSASRKEYKRITTNTLIEMKQHGEKISMLTAYDYSMAKALDARSKVTDALEHITLEYFGNSRLLLARSLTLPNYGSNMRFPTHI